MRGKPWTIDEERRLRQLVEEGLGFNDISQAMGKNRVSVKCKIYNLGLSLKDTTRLQNQVVSSVSSSSKAPIVDPSPPIDSVRVNEVALELKADGPLPSVEKKLRVLDAALVALEQPGLSMAEISRLNKIIQGVKVYEQLFARFVNYSGLESEVLELRKQLASEKKKS
ncbi:MAG TPA: hypothetical protein VK253_02570 [Candidatus Binatia bacterium]|nr:hypothetical protein [Candidatus Binatia bacterium]